MARAIRSASGNGWVVLNTEDGETADAFVFDEDLAAIDAARAAARAADWVFDKCLHVGDDVIWTSQAGGRSKQKIGVVVKVVPPNTHPRDVLVGSDFSVDAGSLGRDHESYLVQVGRHKRLYWPLVSKLNKVSFG